MKFIEIRKKDLLTIPNILCYFRIILVPVFVVLYLRAESAADYLLAAGAAALASLTDLIDGCGLWSLSSLSRRASWVWPDSSCCRGAAS